MISRRKKTAVALCVSEKVQRSMVELQMSKAGS